MFIELIDTLRCPRAHEDSWLVGAFDEIVDRDIRTGRLGCPICRADYPIVDGVVEFDDTGSQVEHDELSAVNPEDVVRLAAMLDLTSPGGLVVLHGEWGRLAPALTGLAEVQCLLLDPPSGFAERERLSAVRCRSTVPVAAGSCRAIALRDRDAARMLALGVERALRARGRLVLPSEAPLPEGFALLAKDARWAVAEHEAPQSPIVKLEIARRK